MAIKLILSDIDGTILDDNNKIDTGLRLAIANLKKQSVPFVLASARSPQGMLNIAKELDVLDNPIACYNGALVVKDLQSNNYSTILSHQLEKAEIEKMLTIIQQNFPKVAINLYSGSDWYVEKIDKWVKIEADITKLTPIVTDLQTLVAKNNLPVHKILLISEPEEIAQVHQRLRDSNLANSSFYLSKPNYLEITNAQVSKEKALRELAKTYNLELSETMSLGDNFNDVPMLKLAGLGVAMDNAPTEVKKSANVVTGTNNQNGVSKAIEKYVL
ncbi:Cof-type HAD-IIB family hydrolase [Companilactobacillus halodurans]|uniref:HAD family phosphatase n=1 Tax=Companilactobacillus halodurans TaxID=2584183 RepID=A0A5P0ZN91_9LACO|nr:Cof-type HAD-IIB family hydrolase [Companilactobacillus halodurans]MQS75685.1 HAD family phosphatase [Companilactobacillus halodurans]MQS97667.1 HAD family phosphatase [Companilactobacillus halodurans]